MQSSVGREIYSRITHGLPRRRHLLPAFLLVAIMVAIVLTTTWSALAAVELAYFTASSTSNTVLLEWGTVQEFNLDGFEILCKRSNEPDTAYHPIGARIAQGGPEQGAEYSLSVTTGIEFGTAYCFRLVEKTSDGTPGEQFDICGYGPGITPTAVLTTTLAGSAETTPTTIIVESPPGATPAPTLQGSPTPTLTWTPDQSASPLSAATPTETQTPTATQLTSPLDQPETGFGGEDDGVGADPAQASQIGADGTPTITPTLTETSTPTVSTTPTETMTEAPTSTALAESIPATATLTPTLDTGAQAPAAPGAGEPIGGAATATPIYVVVTATPTTEMLAMTVPTFTPWPSATPVQSLNLANFLAPTTQNLMVMLLCLIFLSASGLGTLGLITSILYMRSQAKRTQYPGPSYERRRYY